ncbi:riboflavin biosynthesis protein RibF [Parabacteroides sp. 52]|uniref:riboflavin biosynthesis protein RibF n=1 Tax=unclassified Parabacteroides TaxID=2649774 RepID=UPI0013D26A1E|nr:MULTISPECIES: riboflavin biosynthesis protein RibF [unclassified Parabacteroides]MDH6534674.1 riboflavin kinase/FMN adenylyltransferase [Parabacteroides sp. PM5-20]NDV56140.1 riboflavin biosynthesis protein RibF [Parabacteroides sp. 52]
MQIITDPTDLKGIEIVATVGFFDGVHLGHRHLIEKMQETARMHHLPTAVITFSQHPRQVLQADFQPKLLNSFEEKTAHLAETGIDYCIVLDFTVALSRLNAQAFICSILAEKLQAKIVFIGYDHRFGHDRIDGFEQYKLYGASCGIEMINASSYKEGEINVSSSEIRRLLMQGQVEKAEHMLTYPYLIKGHIVHGHKVGHKLGFPTANIQVDEPFKVIPAIGVYAVKVMLEGKSYNGMLYIGNRPTLNNGENISLEVNIFDFSAEVYNSSITVAFKQYIRGDIKFDSLDDLIAQLERDREEVGKVLMHD